MCKSLYGTIHNDIILSGKLNILNETLLQIPVLTLSFKNGFCEVELYTSIEISAIQVEKLLE